MRFSSLVSLIPLLLISLTTATPITPHSSSPVKDTFTAIDSILTNSSSSSSSCPPAAIIFARGTFDSGNAGVWVGPQLFAALPPSSTIATQGVPSAAYPATLNTYLSEGGSNSGAISLASTINSYTSLCPSSSVIISGWSQGALVAHKSIPLLTPESLHAVKALVTFGDPWKLFSKQEEEEEEEEGFGIIEPPVPEGIEFRSYCVTGTVFDPLCAELPKDFEMPDGVGDVVDGFLELPSLAVGVQQVRAAARLVLAFPKQLVEGWGGFVDTVKGKGEEKRRRLLLSPQHFLYGNNGMAEEAAVWIAGVLGL